MLAYILSIFITWRLVLVYMHTYHICIMHMGKIISFRHTNLSHLYYGDVVLYIYHRKAYLSNIMEM